MVVVVVVVVIVVAVVAVVVVVVAVEVVVIVPVELLAGRLAGLRLGGHFSAGGHGMVWDGLKAEKGDIKVNTPT